MITLTNYFAGLLIRLISVVTIKFNPKLSEQFIIIKNVVSSSNSKYKRLPRQLVKSVIDIEDKRFFFHSGIDVYSIIRALIKNITTNRLEGASTIVQQLVRNITDRRELKFKRKINEIILATLVNNLFTKDEILHAYFDTYKFKNSIGIYNFCIIENYNLDNLSFIESAQVASRFKYPHVTKTNYIKYLKRVRTIEIKNTLNPVLLLWWYPVKNIDLNLKKSFRCSDHLA